MTCNKLRRSDINRDYGILVIILIRIVLWLWLVVDWRRQWIRRISRRMKMNRHCLVRRTPNWLWNNRKMRSRLMRRLRKLRRWRRRWRSIKCGNCCLTSSYRIRSSYCSCWLGVGSIVPILRNTLQSLNLRLMRSSISRMMTPLLDIYFKNYEKVQRNQEDRGWHIRSGHIGLESIELWTSGH